MKPSLHTHTYPPCLFSHTPWGWHRLLSTSHSSTSEREKAFYSAWECLYVQSCIGMCVCVCVSTLASASVNQHVSFLALAAVGAHVVETAPSLAVGRSLTLVYIWGETVQSHYSVFSTTQKKNKLCPHPSFLSFPSRSIPFQPIPFYPFPSSDFQSHPSFLSNPILSNLYHTIPISFHSFPSHHILSAPITFYPAVLSYPILFLPISTPSHLILFHLIPFHFFFTIHPI